nr:2-methylaconitate cis-trans isomerase PrpF family protein [Gallibacterium genomosp. 1]
MSEYKPQIKIRATYMRGGTSKGTFINIADLPEEVRQDPKKRDKLVQRIVGSPDLYKQQIDGMGAQLLLHLRLCWLEKAQLLTTMSITIFVKSLLIKMLLI